MSRSPLVPIDGTLNSTRYISSVLRPIVQGLHNPTFPQNMAQPHVTSIVWTLLDMDNVRLFLWPARSPDLLPKVNV
ncbi:transposable element Tcb1 transposase [Trichonephila clavipes]|nr:transposable element Tcb1 transposase [Trichonephila clavipes]